VRLRETLGWWEQMPLFGRRVLVPRAPEQSSDMVGALRAAGAQPVAIPLIAFGPPESEDARRLADALRDLPRYDAVVFASSNAVRFTAEAAAAAGVDLAVPGPRFVCVGRRTADALLDRGLPVHCVAAGGRGGGAEALLEVLSKAIDPAGRRFLLPRSQLGRDTLSAGLRAAGAEVDALTAYRTLRPDIDGDGLRRRIAAGEIDVLTFTSPSTVQHLLEWLDEPAREAAGRCTIAAIGATTARALRREGLEPDVVPTLPDGAALVEALVRHFAVERN
jgi:uroporphyrinogen III methyltransferase/synthase